MLWSAAILYKMEDVLSKVVMLFTNEA